MPGGRAAVAGAMEKGSEARRARVEKSLVYERSRERDGQRKPATFRNALSPHYELPASRCPGACIHPAIRDDVEKENQNVEIIDDNRRIGSSASIALC